MTEGKETESIISQGSYTPSQYEDATWEMLGERIETQDFQPLEIPVLPSHKQYVDPMFADFGGTYMGQEPVRWHLPPELAYEGSGSRKAEEEEQEPLAGLTESQVEQLTQEAFEEGRKSGLQEAEQKRELELKTFNERLQTLFEDMQKQLEEHLQLVEKQAVQLALAVSKKIIDRAVEINPEYIVDIISKAVALAGTASVKTIRVSPQDHEFIEVVGVGKSIKGFEEHWQFVPDASIKAGCIVETSGGEIDYQLDPAWERIEAQVVKIAK